MHTLDPALENRPIHPLLRAAVLLGVLVPVLYFGVQIAVAPWYPGHSYVHNVASHLGSDLSPKADVFNRTVQALGVVIAATALAFGAGLRSAGAAWWRIVPLCIAMLTIAVQTFWAAYYPMPDPRHGGHPAFIAGMLLFPPAMFAAMWPYAGRLGRAYFIFTLIHLAVMVPIMSGIVLRETLADAQGVKQRLFTVALFMPFAVGAVILSRRLKRAGA